MVTGGSNEENVWKSNIIGKTWYLLQVAVVAENIIFGIATSEILPYLLPGACSLQWLNHANGGFYLYISESTKTIFNLWHKGWHSEQYETYWLTTNHFNKFGDYGLPSWELLLISKSMPPYDYKHPNSC